ncbi:MAG: ABC transporter ATP-binding protein [Rikenellaceae bacterium]|nr:ABC transporter ATP-binding protein [Rikenellaceae bacterium]
MNTLIKIRDLSVHYDSHRVLHDVDLDIYADDFLGVIGPNGGGKTTLVKAILGAVPHTGTIEFSPALYDGMRRLIGYMPQQSNFDRAFPISVRETVVSGLQALRRMSGRYSREDYAAADRLLEQTGLQSIARSPIGEISGGQMQRTLLCRALIAEPRLLILDEPANFVDNRFEGELYELLKQLNERIAIVMVSHDLGTITSVVKNIVCVNGHVHRHESNVITAEQLDNYNCPIQIIAHGHVPHTVLEPHK